jgi:hypothetical protein
MKIYRDTCPCLATSATKQNWRQSWSLKSLAHDTALAPDRCANFLEGLKSGGSYRYGDTPVSPGSTKSEGFSCQKGQTVNIVSLASS